MFRQRKRAAAAALGFSLLTACTYRPSSFPVYGAADDRSPLTGDWSGEFESAHPGWNGSISIQLEPGRDSARGDVSLVPLYVGRETGYREYRLDTPGSGGAALRVRYVRARAPIVEGELEPFHDRDCDCMVTTMFRGIVRGDSITGHYVSRGRWTTRQGAWRMNRRVGPR